MLQTSENYNSIQYNRRIIQQKNMPFILWSVQYTIYSRSVKNETPFNIRLNNHMEDVKDFKAIQADKNFQKNGHRFN